MTATASVEMVGADAIPVPLDQKPGTRCTIGRLTLSVVDVASIYVSEPVRLGLFARTRQRLGRRAGKVEHAVVRVKRAEVQRDVYAEFLGKPVAQAVDFFTRVVLPGDQQRGHFEPHGRFVPEVLERLEHG